MARYGADIQSLARVYGGKFLQTADPSADALLYLALAFAALERLSNRGAVDLTLDGRPLVTPSLERAFREMAYLRSRLPVEWLSDEYITRIGRPAFRNESEV
jgi:hypothetical protein